MVETLDKYFENVCELDIMFNIEKAHFIIDEMIMTGYITETNKANILNPVIAIVKSEGKWIKKITNHIHRVNSVFVFIFYPKVYAFIFKKYTHNHKILKDKLYFHKNQNSENLKKNEKNKFFS